MKRWIVVEMDSGDDKDDGGLLPPEFDVFPFAIEFYCEFEIITDSAAPTPITDALRSGVIKRQWWCYSDKGYDCEPDSDNQGYPHDTCRWYWSMSEIDVNKIEEKFQAEQAQLRKEK